MRFTIHVLIGKDYYLLDCGLTTAQATELALKLEDLGYEFRIDAAGSASEPLGSPLVFIAQLARVSEPLPVFGRSAA